MSAARVAGALGSLAVHAALLLGPLVNTPPPVELQTPVVAQERSDDDAMLIVSAPGVGDNLSCKNTYRGIGVRKWPNGRITEVVDGGPADRAGVKVGDYLLSDALFSRDQYPLGQRLPLRIERDGQRLDLIVYVGTVCYEVPHTVPHLKEQP